MSSSNYLATTSAITAYLNNYIKTGTSGNWTYIKTTDDYYIMFYSGQLTNVACTTSYGGHCYCDKTIEYPFAVTSLKFLICGAYTESGIPHVNIKNPAPTSTTCYVRFMNPISITWAAIGLCILCLTKKA